MRYRVRGPLHADTEHIATELRGFIAHTGPIRLSYLQMHGVAAHTIDVNDSGAAFFEETVLPKIGATGSFVEQRTPLRQPKELKVTATLCPTTATTLPNLSAWAGVWGEVVYGPRRATVRLRCLPEDAERLRELESQGWRVLRGPAAALSALSKAAPFAPQFWPSRAGCAASLAAASPAQALTPPSADEEVVTPAALAPAGPKMSSLTASDVLAASADVPHFLLGVTPVGHGVRLAWRAMLVAVQDQGQRQEPVIQALLLRALSQGMGAVVIAERSRVAPRALAPLAKRLRIIDMADPWESARIPWRAIPPEGLKLLLGNNLPSPLPDNLADALRAAGRRTMATPVLEALTSGEADDLAGALEAGGGVVLLVEAGGSASLLASMLILYLSLAPLTRPLLICRPASLPMPPALADRAIQFVFGDAPTAAVQLQATTAGWSVLLPDRTKLTLQENLAAPEERTGTDHAALVAVLTGGTSAGGTVADELPAGLGWPDTLEDDEEAPIGLAAAAELPADEGGELPAGLGWLDTLEDDEEAPIGLAAAAELPAAEGGELPAGLGWLDTLEEAAEPGPVGAELPTDEGEEGPIGLAAAVELPADDESDALTAWEPIINVDEAPGLDVDAWAVELLDDDTFLPMRPPRRRRQVAARRRQRLHFTPSARNFGIPVIGLAAAAELPADEGGELPAGLGWLDTLEEDEEAPIGLAAAAELPAAEGGELPAGLGWLDTLEEAAEPGPVGAELPTDEGEEGPIGLAAAAELPADEGGELELIKVERPADGGEEVPAKEVEKASIGFANAAELYTPVENNDIAALVVLWHGGASLTELARTLRQQRPGLSLLDAMQELKAAIQSSVAPSEPALAAHQPAHDNRLVELLRRLAVEEPEHAAGHDALSRWQAGGQRRAVVREIALAYGLKEPEARTVYDRVILPRVINSLNGSAAAVVHFLRQPSSEQGEMPPIVLDCLYRLLGTRNANLGAMRPLLPMLRETLEALDKTGRA